MILNLDRHTTERANLKPQDSSPSRIAAAPPVIHPTLRESKPAEIAIAFPDNAAASVVFGHYDQNIARIEREPRRFGLRQRQPDRHQGPARGERAGAPGVRDALRARQAGPAGERGRRRGRDRRKRLSGPAVSRRGGVQGQFRRHQDAQARRRARPQRRAGPISGGACASTSWSSPKAPPAPARPGSRSATRCPCSSRVWSNGWFCRAPRSRPASASAFCPAT